MLDFLNILIRVLILVIAAVAASIVIIFVLARFPGVILALSTIAIGVFAVALYKGSFSAVGLHTTKSIKIAGAISIVLLIISLAIILFGFFFA